MIGAVEIFGTPINTDSWDGYPAERQKLFDHLSTNNIDNMVVLTGDIHTSWAVDLKNGNNPVGVEMVTPSVTSPGSPINLSNLITLQNPNIKYVELTKRGFILVDITPQRVQGDWYNVSTINEINASSSCVKSYVSNLGNNSLTLTNTPANGHGAFPQALAGPCSRFFVGLEDAAKGIVLGLYPNPSADYLTIQGMNIIGGSLSITDLSGKSFDVAHETTTWPNGLEIIQLDIRTLPSGTYVLVNGNLYEAVKFTKP